MADKKTVTVDFTKVAASGESLKAMGDALIANFTGFKANVQMWLVSAALHFIEHGDFTEIPRVVDGLGEGFKAKAVRDWLGHKHEKIDSSVGLVWTKKDKEAGLPARFVPNHDVRKALRKRYLADREAFTALMLTTTPWYEFAPEKEYDGFNFYALAAALAKKGAGVLADEEKRSHKKTQMAGYAEFVQWLESRKKTTGSNAPTPAAAAAIDEAGEVASLH